MASGFFNLRNYYGGQFVKNRCLEYSGDKVDGVEKLIQTTLVGSIWKICFSEVEIWGRIYVTLCNSREKNG